MSDTCGFEADSNIYGIGARLGIYLQWVGSLITYRYIREETVSIGAVNFIFQLSNFVSLLYISSKRNINGGGRYAIECWIVLLICTGAIFPGLILSPDEKAKKKKELEKAEDQSDATRLIQHPDPGPSTSNVGRQTTPNDPDPSPVKVSTKGEVFQTALSAATQLFAVWFVFKGMDELFAPVNSRSAFVFAKVVSCWIDATHFS